MLQSEVSVADDTVAVTIAANDIVTVILIVSDIATSDTYATMSFAKIWYTEFQKLVYIPNF